MKDKNQEAGDNSTQIQGESVTINNYLGGAAQPRRDNPTGRSRYMWLLVVAPLVVVVIGVAIGIPLLGRRDGSSDPAANIASIQPSVPSTPPPTAGVRPKPVTGWYELVQYRAVVWNNGFDIIDPVRIGAQSFPSSIVGNYASSAGDQMNKATWALAGACTTLSMWIGKDADSSYQAGVGRFVISVDGREIFSADRSLRDAAQEVTLDISGAVQVTLFDTRRGQEARNAWGRPRVECSSPPGPKR
ncbi:NPCBM/NEW2 domain-containing protein [Nocardia sp. NPDC005366]|uniref:NPCBM/NEW2 domain-containing protein n=1 Tax=Nocardia sp. NPDC005366 TaxID=3156878 RepID=UPI0033AD89BD